LGNFQLGNCVGFCITGQLLNYQLTQLPNLLHLFMRCVLAAALAEFAVFQTTRRGLLILGRRVIPFFALAAL
jgi:hypothetical protein